MKLHKIILFLLTLAAFAGYAQEPLALDEAIRLALEKNYQVRIARNEQAIASLQNNLGNAGMSPTVSAQASLGNSNINSYQEFNNGQVQDRPGAKAVGTQASLNAEWTVFDGMRMFAVKKRLNLTEDLSEMELKQQMENTVYEVISAYYNIVRLKALLKAAQQNLALYEERRKIAELRLEIGSDSKVEVLLSKSDENKARTAILQLELDLLALKTNFNNLLGRQADVAFTTRDTIEVSYNPTLEDLQKASLQGNRTIMLSRQNELIFRQSVNEAKAFSLPFVTVSGAYIYNRNRSQAGFVLLNRQQGLNFGLNARWLIFNGGRNHRLVQERNILALNQQLFREQAELLVNALVMVQYQKFLLNQKIVGMEQANLRDSKEVQTISLERYRIGKASLLETIETQKNLEDAQVRFYNALFEVKLAEAELLRASGSLVK